MFGRKKRAQTDRVATQDADPFGLQAATDVIFEKAAESSLGPVDIESIAERSEPLRGGGGAGVADKWIGTVTYTGGRDSFAKAVETLAWVADRRPTGPWIVTLKSGLPFLLKDRVALREEILGILHSLPIDRLGEVGVVLPHALTPAALASLAFAQGPLHTEPSWDYADGRTFKHPAVKEAAAEITTARTETDRLIADIRAGIASREKIQARAKEIVAQDTPLLDDLARQEHKDRIEANRKAGATAALDPDPHQGIVFATSELAVAQAAEDDAAVAYWQIIRDRYVTILQRAAIERADLVELPRNVLALEAKLKSVKSRRATDPYWSLYYTTLIARIEEALEEAAIGVTSEAVKATHPSTTPDPWDKVPSQKQRKALLQEYDRGVHEGRRLAQLGHQELATRRNEEFSKLRKDLLDAKAAKRAAEEEALRFQRILSRATCRAYEKGRTRGERDLSARLKNADRALQAAAERFEPKETFGQWVERVTGTKDAMVVNIPTPWKENLEESLPDARRSKLEPEGEFVDQKPETD